MSALGRCRSFALVALAAAGWLGCDGRAQVPAAESARSAAAPASRATLTARPAALGPGDAERGRALMSKHQCNRCHAGTPEPPAPRDSHCVTCHQEILAGTFPAAPDKLARWQPHVRPVRAAPSLLATAERFDREWLARFLLEPSDLRPLLAPSMPRLSLSVDDARDIATYLTRNAAAGEAPATVRATADAERGRALLETRGCGGCHRFSRVPALPQAPLAELSEHHDAILLAPDLVHTRERWTRAALVAWLRDPRALKPDTLMPATGFDDAEARDVAAYLLAAPLLPAPEEVGARRLPALTRRVTFAEVDEKVLRLTCRHCHSNPDASLGDGGPGNTGGFGFRGRAIDLSSYRGALSGYRDEKGERRSLFEPTAEGVPRLVAALLARQDEQAGKPQRAVRGMPLGLPALSSEQIQLVDSWIAQGRPE